MNLDIDVVRVLFLKKVEKNSELVEEFVISNEKGGNLCRDQVEKLVMKMKEFGNNDRKNVKKKGKGKKYHLKRKGA